MARIEIVHPGKEDRPGSTEIIEVRAWDLGGTKEQAFYIGSGLNYRASGNIWLEFIYSIEGAQVLYTRNFLHLDGMDATQRLQQLDELAQNGEGSFGFGFMLPETSLMFTAKKFTYQDDDEGGDGGTKTYSHCTLELSADVGAVFGYSSPGSRWVGIKTRDIDIEEGVGFMRELVYELDAVLQGKHPDPACLPAGSSEWPLVWQLNRKAYNKLADSYREDYFVNPLLAEAFDGWLAKLPPNGQVLDAGCGHGDPVIARLLEKGFRVTGADFSSEMLGKARQKFPQVTFVQQATTQLVYDAVFDGACSFSSLLYLDPIDFYNALYRLSGAIKPGGLLFLYALDSAPDWRGEPFNVVMAQWMWVWHYGMQEAAHRLEEHGYFQVLEMKRVNFNAEEEQRIAQEIEDEKLKEAEYNRQEADSQKPFRMPYLSSLHERPPYAYVIIAQRR